MPDSAELLAAIAAAGSRGKTAYENAQAALAQQKAAAIQSALGSSVAGNAPAGAQATLANIVGQGYAPQQAALTQNQAGAEDYYGRLGASAKTFMDQTNAVIPVIEAQLAARLSSSSGGGGGGGGGSTSTPFDDLLSAYHGKENLIDALTPLSKQAGIEQGDLAVQMGVPGELAYSWFPKYDTAAQTAMEGALASDLSVPEFRQQVQAIARARGGNQIVQRKQFVKQYRRMRRKKHL